MWCGSRSKRASILSPTASRAKRASSATSSNDSAASSASRPAPGKEMQTAGGGQGIPRFSRLLRVVRAHRRAVRRAKRRARARRRRYLHRAGQLQGPRGGPDRHRQPQGGSEGPDLRGSLCACDRFFLRCVYLCQRVLPHPRGVRAGRIRRACAKSTRPSSTPDSFSRSTIRAWSATT